MNHAALIHQPVRRTGTGDVDEFQLPLAGLYADLELGTASLRLPAEFLEQPGLVQLRLLAAWQRDLARYRDAALRRLADELAESSPGCSADAQLELLRSTCAALHIDIADRFGGKSTDP